MGSLSTILVLGAAFVAVFAQSTFNGFRNVVGAQIDVLPGLVVYASLSHRLWTVALLAVLGGLWYDSMSANPLGLSILPLFLVGFMIQRYRILILRDELFAQVGLGLAASALVPLLSLLILLNVERQPLIGWATLWQWVVVSVGGALLTPLWFHFFDRISQAVNYRPVGETSFRADREIKRGRS